MLLFRWRSRLAVPTAAAAPTATSPAPVHQPQNATSVSGCMMGRVGGRTSWANFTLDGACGGLLECTALLASRCPPLARGSALLAACLPLATPCPAPPPDRPTNTYCPPFSSLLPHSTSRRQLPARAQQRAQAAGAHDARRQQRLQPARVERQPGEFSCEGRQARGCPCAGRAGPREGPGAAGQAAPRAEPRPGRPARLPFSPLHPPQPNTSTAGDISCIAFTLASPDMDQASGAGAVGVMAFRQCCLGSTVLGGAGLASLPAARCSRLPPSLRRLPPSLLSPLKSRASPAT